MSSTFFSNTAGGLALAAGLIAAPLSASAGSYTQDGVTFTFTDIGNVLTLEIDAAGHSGGWATATNIGTVQVKDVGTFSSVALSGEGGTSAASLWTFSPNELSANGCTGGSGGNQRACFYAASTSDRIGLTDDMLFHFTFTGGTQNFSNPELKVAFYNGNSPDKVGSLLSVNIPAVPEPDTYGMLMLGLGILGYLARTRKA